MTPPKPRQFAPHLAPEGVEVNLGAFRTAQGGNWWANRPVIHPRLTLVHTNGASREGSIEAAINWGNANPASNTHPHYQVDRWRACKLVPTDRKGIGNHAVSDWSIVIETADEGYPIPGQAAGFIGSQVETIATILAYESIVWGIPLMYPATWNGAGTASHTEPFGYPHWTNAPGKVCPGRTKKQQVVSHVIPRARDIVAAWMTPPPIPEDLPMTFLWKPKGWKNVFLVDGGGAIHCSPELLAVASAQKVPTVPDNGHTQMLKSVLTLSGIELDDLVPE